jgi:hypothetical protein
MLPAHRLTRFDSIPVTSHYYAGLNRSWLAAFVDSRFADREMQVSEGESQVEPHSEEHYESLVNELLPLRFGSLLTVPRLGWEHFPGAANEAMKWSAHVYWNIDYHVNHSGKKPSVNVNVHILPKSWVKNHKKCAHLLNHEQGHFLIANLCALEFLRRVHTHHHVSQ